MLDIQLVRDHPELIKKACEDKQLDPSVVDSLIEADKKRREQQQLVDELRQQANANADKIKQAVAAGGKPDPTEIEQGKAIKQQLKQAEPQLAELEQGYHQLMMQIPNPPAADVPVGKDETGNVVIATVGEIPQFEFPVKSHQEIMENLDWLDTKRAVKIAGFRAYFLKGEGLLLEQALLRYALKLLVEEGFTPMSAPSLVNSEAMWGTGFLPWGKEDHYQTQDKQYLTGTAEVPLTSYYMNETLSQKDLPVKLCGLSPCFRREIGTHGKDTQGIVRVHQFNKIEQVVLTIADEEETRNWHEKIRGFSEKLLQNLGLPYQVLLMCTGDMGAGQKKKYDLETWFPAQNKYRETHSASYFNDFQARRLNIRYQAADGTLKYVYTLNNTMAATPRLLAACVENWQTADGSVQIPEFLKNLLWVKSFSWY